MNTTETTIYDIAHDTAKFYSQDWTYQGDKITMISGRDKSTAHVAEDDIQIHVKTKKGPAKFCVHNQELVQY